MGLVKEICQPKYWLLIAMSIICLLASTIIEFSITTSTYEYSRDEYVEQLKSHWYVNPYTLASFLRELGFAAIVALIIILLVEISAKKKQTDEAGRLLQRIAKNAFEGALGYRLPESIREHVIKSIFNASVIGIKYDATYQFMELGDEYSHLRSKYMLLEINVKQRIQNIGTETVRYQHELYIPKCANDELDGLVDVSMLNIGGRNVTPKKEETETFERRYKNTTEIKRDHIIEVVCTYMLVKEKSDNEIWTSLLARDNVELTIDMRIPNMIWGVSGQNRDNLKSTGDVQSQGRTIFSLPRPLLPMQSINVWWRPGEPGG